MPKLNLGRELRKPRFWLWSASIHDLTYYLAFLILVVTAAWFWTAGGRSQIKCLMMEDTVDQIIACNNAGGVVMCSPRDKWWFLNVSGFFFDPMNVVNVTRSREE